MNLDDASERANQLVAVWIFGEYRAEGGDAHLRECPDAKVSSAEGGDGVYGCTTGCEFVRLEATVSCSHGHEDPSWSYGAFGDLPDIIADLEKGRMP